MDNVKKVLKGETINVTYPDYHPHKVKTTVNAPCSNKNNGQWYCATCDVFFMNQLEKDCHLSEKPKTIHRLAWNCFEHGLEQP